MIKFTLRILLGLWLTWGLASCTTQDEYTNSPLDNYNALWRILDERYAFFDIKLPANTTWRDLYNKYLPEIRPDMSQDSLLLIMTQLTGELRDGHVNISTPFDYGRYWGWKEDYPRNYSADLVDIYLGKDYRIAGGLYYTQLQAHNHTADSIGYLRFSSFSSGLSDSNLNASLSRLSKCQALIIDIRDNGGGDVTLSDRFARHFMSSSRLVARSRHKTGPGHQDFSPLIDVYLDPITEGVKWLRPVVLLTNRGVYSAANDFTLKMKGLPFVTVIGDKTGGGGGLPMSSELPNGWAIRYSSTQTYDSSGYNIELGIEPDYYVSMDSKDLSNGYDTLIESSIKYLLLRLEEAKRTKIWRK